MLRPFNEAKLNTIEINFVHDLFYRRIKVTGETIDLLINFSKFAHNVVRVFVKLFLVLVMAELEVHVEKLKLNHLD